MGTTFDIVFEVFTWVGFAGAAVFAIIAVVLWAADGSWMPAQAIVERTPEGGATVRWHDDHGDVNEAALNHADAARLDPRRELIDIYYRLGWQHRARLTQHSPSVRAMLWLAVGLAGVGAVALIASLVVLFAAG